MNSTRKAVEVLIFILGLAIIAYTYAYGVKGIENKTASVRSTNATLKNTADAYKVLYDYRDAYAKSTQDMANTFAGKEANFVYGVSTEDEIIYMKQMEAANEVEQLALTYLSMGAPNDRPYAPAVETNVAFQTGAISAPSIPDDGIVMYAYPMDYGFTVSYKGFKDMVKYLVNVGTKKQITDINLSFDNTTGLLSGVLAFEQYALIGTGNEYQPLIIPSVNTSVENIFGTIEVPEEKEEEDTKDSKSTKKK